MNEGQTQPTKSRFNLKKLAINLGRLALLICSVLLVNYGAKKGVYSEGARIYVMLVAMLGNIALIFLTTTHEERLDMWRAGKKH